MRDDTGGLSVAVACAGRAAAQTCAGARLSAGRARETAGRALRVSFVWHVVRRPRGRVAPPARHRVARIAAVKAVHAYYTTQLHEYMRVSRHERPA
eukprot:1172277-Prymnesium_polylepis.3